MYRPIDRGVKLAAVNIWEKGLMDLADIIDCCDMSRSTFFRIVKLWRETGDVVRHNTGRPGRPPTCNLDDVAYLIRLIRHRPDWFLDELRDLLEQNRFIAVHLSTVQRELIRAGISVKKLKKIAKERDPLLRAAHRVKMAQYTPEQLGFLDETHKNKKTTQRLRGRAKKGHRAEKREVFVRGQRVTATGLLTVDGMMASKVVEGSMTRDLFLEFLEDQVLPLSSPFPGPLSVLVLDNARIHHGEQIVELCEQFGVRLEYLPPYSPDYNPIEEAFAQIKAWIRRNNDCLTDIGLVYDMYQAMDVVTNMDAMGYFIHAGYF